MKWACRRAACAAVALALAAAPTTALAEKPRARGGTRLMLAMEQAPATVVAEVENTSELAGSGHAATLRVESSVVGEIAHGVGLKVAWEELAASRASRFRVGDRVLVVLEPLPGASVWLNRLPDASERASTLAIAMRGNAFLRNPAPGEVLLLQHYLALVPTERAGAAGVGYLAQLAAGAQLPLAIDAVARLAARTDLDARVSESTAHDLVRALLREDASAELEEALLALVAGRRPGALRARLVAMTGGDQLAPPIVYAALAEYDEGISPELGARLAEQSPERYRRVAARSASGEGADDVLRSLLRSDPAPSVRASAIERLVELRGEAAIAPVAGALYDPEPSVRVTAARQLGALGDDAVPELRRVAEGNDLEAARAAIAGLMWSGAGAGHDALVELAEEHPDDSVRMLADVALGRKTGHGHD